MNSQSVDWIPALGVLAGGLLFGAILLWRVATASRRAGRTPAALPVQVRDLAGKRDALLRQLRELDDTASKRTPEQLARERYALELEAARVLLALDERGAHADARPSGTAGARRSKRARPAPPPRTALRGFLWGTGSATALLLLGFFVYQSAKPRQPGGSVTGDAPMAGPPAGGGASEEEARIESALARNPDDVDAHLARAQALLARQDWMGVWNETTQVLQRQPGNPQGLAYQALVRLAMGQSDLAVTLLKRAIAADPDLVDAYAYLALADARMGRMKDAEAVIARASKRFPDRAAELGRYLADLQKQEPAGAEAASLAGKSNPHAGIGMPGDGAAVASSPSAKAGRGVSGTIDLDPSLRSAIAPGAILFVFVRPAGVSAGPPVAVKRLPATFPATFELTEADSMMGQPFPDPLLIEARLDSDGDPTTRPPTDPKARIDRVKAGRTDLRLVLTR